MQNLRVLCALLALTSAQASAQLPLGSAVQVNQDNVNFQSRPQVAMAPDGSGWFVWSNFHTSDVSVRSFNVAGSMAAEATLNTHLPNSQFTPKIDVNGSGDRAISWVSIDQFGASSDRDTIVRHSTGGSLGAEILGQADSVAEPDETDVAIHSDDSLIAVWREGGTLWAHRWASNSNSLGDDESVAFDANMMWFAVAARPSGGSVVVFEAPAVSHGVYARLLAADASGMGFPLPLSETDEFPGTEPDVDSDDLGAFVAVWVTPGFGHVYARQFRADGTALSGDIQVTTSENIYRYFPKVALGPDGSFVVGWSERTSPGADDHIFAREFTRTGRAVGGPFAIEDDSDALLTSLSMGRGRFMAVWQAPDQDFDGVFARLYERRVIFSDGFEGGTTQYW
jgi:hypothetical protein